MNSIARTKLNADRRHFICGSKARIIMGQDDKALIRLWQEKPGEVGPEDNRPDRPARPADRGPQPHPVIGSGPSGSPTFTPSCAFGTELRHRRRSRR
jgi:hypothetical protein